MVAMPSASSAGPYPPDMPMQPSPSSETTGPLRPRRRVRMTTLQKRARRHDGGARPIRDVISGGADGRQEAGDFCFQPVALVSERTGRAQQLDRGRAGLAGAAVDV